MANVTKCGSWHHLEDPHNVSNYFPYLYIMNNESRILSGFTVLICLIGLLGNGAVLWFLCSNMRRNSFMFIKNLSVADLGVLLALSTNFLLFFVVDLHGQASYAIYIIHLCLHNVYAWMHYASANFLMIISMDRCVAVLFPIWYRCHQSKFLLATASVFLWAMSCLLAALSFFFRFCHDDMRSNLVSFTIMYCLMVFSTGVLSLKVCCSSHLRRRGKLLVAILISLVFFIITMVPRGFFSEVAKKNKMLASFILFLKSFNSSINPIIYFFVAILKADLAKGTLKALFHKFFREEDTGVEGETSINMNSVVPTSATATSYNCA